MDPRNQSPKAEGNDLKSERPAADANTMPRRSLVSVVFIYS